MMNQNLTQIKKNIILQLIVKWLWLAKQALLSKIKKNERNKTF